jgi:hypothetical protein
MPRQRQSAKPETVSRPRGWPWINSLTRLYDGSTPEPGIRSRITRRRTAHLAR